MSDISLKVLAKGCPRLRFLNLSGCDKVLYNKSDIAHVLYHLN